MASTIGFSISAQARVIFACASRMLYQKTRETPLGPASALVEPLATIGIMTLVFSNIRFRVPSLGDWLMIFLMTGILPITVFRQSIQQGVASVKKLNRVFVMPQVQPLDAMFAGVFTSLLIVWTLFMGITIFFVIFYGMRWPQNIVLCFIPAFSNMMLGLGFAMINLVIMTWWKYWGTVFATLTGPIGIMSGMFYTIDRMPKQVQDILYYNPLMHSTELVRTFYFHEYTSTFFDPYYYFGTTYGVLFVGLICERVFRYRILHNKN